MFALAQPRNDFLQAAMSSQPSDGETSGDSNVCVSTERTYT